jgi:hypothetical protein
MKPSFVLIALLLLAACATPLPQTPPPGMPAQVSAPQIRVGDEWAYRTRDGFTGLDRGSQRYRVTEAGSNQIVIAVSRGGAADEVQVYDPQWNWMKRPATNLQSFDYSPAYAAFAFPLAAGKRWQARVTATDPADGRRFPVSIEGVVLGWERVKVPAGEFDALKIRRFVFFDYWEHTVRGRSEIVEFEWYAPAVKQAVRREASSIFLSYLYGRGAHPGFFYTGERDDSGGARYVRDDWLIDELVSYSVR